MVTYGEGVFACTYTGTVTWVHSQGKPQALLGAHSAGLPHLLLLCRMLSFCRTSACNASKHSTVLSCVQLCVSKNAISKSHQASKCEPIPRFWCGCQPLLTRLETGQGGGSLCYVAAVRAPATDQLRQPVLDGLCCHVDALLPANEACMVSVQGHGRAAAVALRWVGSSGTDRRLCLTGSTGLLAEAC